jgi:outer membrane protein assembly factor BamA
MRVSYEVAPKIANSLSRQTGDIDARYYQRLGATGLLALRARYFHSWGDAPDFMYFGGNSEMRGYDYLSFIGDTSAFFNAELRFPLIEAMLTPIGILGGIRGVFFANFGGAHFKGQDFTWLTNSTTTYRPIVDYQQIDLLRQDPVYGDPVVIDGLRLVDSRASYGLGLETFALGFPIHFDYSWRTLLNKKWEDQVFAAYGGSSWFRKPKFTVWIGYDF